MKLPRHKREEVSATITQSLWLIVLCSGLFVLTAYATDPSWWSSPGTGTQSAVVAEQVVTNGGVVTTNYVPNDYAVVTQGQLKQFTARAVDALNSELPGGAGATLTNLVYGWAQDYATNGYATNTANPARPYKPSDLQAENVGQLKYIASLVYGQLAGAGYTGLYPSWIEVNTNTDGAAANLGQLKEVFNFDLSTAPVAVTDLVATTGNADEIDLSWTLPAVDNANALTLLVSTDDGVTWTTLATLSPTATGYTATGLDPSQTYTFAVALGNGAGSSVSGSTTPTQPPSPPPAAPTGLTGILDSSNDMDLTWTASAGASSYVIDRETLVTGTWTLSYATSTTASYTDTGYGTYNDVTYGVGGYHYRVSAVNAGGVSAPSTEFPLSRYAVINFGLNMIPIKITNSGFILMVDNNNGTYYRWSNGTASPLTGSPGEYFFNDIAEDGTVVGSFSDETNNITQEAVWPPTSSTPTLSPALPGVPLYWPTPFSYYYGTLAYDASSDVAVAIAGSTIMSQRSVGVTIYDPFYSPIGDIPLSLPTDLFANGVEVGSVTGPTTYDELNSGSTPYVYAPQDQLIAANNTGQMLLNETFWNSVTDSSTSQIVLGSTVLDFYATGISNPVLGTTYAIGSVANFTVGIWWDGLTDHVMTDGYPYSLSAQTALTTGGSPAPALQMVGSSTLTGYDPLSLLWQMDPNTGLFGSALNLSDLLPANVPWVGFYGANPKMINDSGIIIGQTIGSTDGQAYGAALIPNYIERDGNMVTSTNNTVCVGQQINLTNYVSTNIPPSAITSYQWNIPGATSGTNATAFYDYEPNATNSGYVPLTNSYLTNSSCNFYWCGDATNLPVSCTEVIYGQTNTVSATLNVVRPQAEITATQMGTIAADTNYNQSAIYGIPYLHFGAAIGTNVGMNFTQANSVPSPYTGTFEWVQIILGQTNIVTTATSTNTSVSGGLDSAFPYTTSPGASDSPGSPLATTSTAVSRYFNAIMYLMWQCTNAPTGDKTIPVPLRDYQWNWSGTATNATSTNNGTGWGLQSSAYPANATDVDVTNEPTWTTNDDLNWHSLP